MRVLVCGGRNYADRDFLTRYMDNLHERVCITHVINGGARGADMLARNWAIIRDVDALTYPADWKEHGRAAGPIRNQKMLEEGKPDLVLAFPGGRGRRDHVRHALPSSSPPNSARWHDG